jgi:hypothetical protein
MKKLQIVLGLGILGAMFLFNACEEDTTNAFPKISYDDESPVVLESGEDSYSLTGTIVASAGLESVTVTRTTTSGGTVPVATVTDFDGTEVTEVDDSTYNFRFELSDITEETTIDITALDKDGQEASKPIVIQVTTLTLITHAGIELGAQENATGSFFASFEGDVYTISQLNSGDHFADVDIIYYYGNTNKEALFSPQSIVDNDISWGGDVPIASWGGSPNETLFKEATAADYDDATYSSVETLANGASLEIANGGENPIDGLDVSDTYVFKTADNKYGIFKVSAVDELATGVITIDVKIQE